MSNPRIPFLLSSQQPSLPPLEDKRIIVNIVVNVEHWPFDSPMPRALMTPPHGRGGEPPDVPNFSWVEYGLRCGMPRLLNLLEKRGIKASVAMNARVCDVYPSLAEAIGKADWDIFGHGLSQQSLKVANDEVAVVAESIERLSSFYGKRLLGWLGPGIAQTAKTPDVLKAQGIEYIHDWMVDDLPCWMKTAHGPLLSLPYTLELNDVPIWAIQALSSDELLKRVEATLAVFEQEITYNPRIMTIALHPHLIGVAHRFYYFEKIIDILEAHPDVVFATSGCIAEWYTDNTFSPQ